MKMIRVLLVFLSIIGLTAVAIPHGAAEIPSGKSAAKPAAAIDGFRSAKFGMDEDAVRKAIVADFRTKGDKIVREVHPTEKTTVLSLTADNLLPESGPAQISYIFGYQSQKLIQVNVAWIQFQGMNLGAAATILRNHFLGLEFQADSVVANAKLPDGSLLAFRGIDSKGRMVTVHYQPFPKPEKPPADAAKIPEGALRLSYIESPEKPDAFVLKPGQF